MAISIQDYAQRNNLLVKFDRTDPSFLEDGVHH